MKAVQTVRPDKVVFFLGFFGDGGLEEEEDFELLDFGKATTSSEPFWLSFFFSVLRRCRNPPKNNGNRCRGDGSSLSSFSPATRAVSILFAVVLALSTSSLAVSTLSLK
jgi:hypothetical protein